MLISTGCFTLKTWIKLSKKLLKEIKKNCQMLPKNETKYVVNGHLMVLVKTTLEIKDWNHVQK